MAAIRCNVCGRSEAEVRAAVWARGGGAQRAAAEVSAKHARDETECTEQADAIE